MSGIDRTSAQMAPKLGGSKQPKFLIADASAATSPTSIYSQAPILQTWWLSSKVGRVQIALLNDRTYVAINSKSKRTVVGTINDALPQAIANTKKLLSQNKISNLFSLQTPPKNQKKLDEASNAAAGYYSAAGNLGADIGQGLKWLGEKSNIGFLKGAGNWFISDNEKGQKDLLKSGYDPNKFSAGLGQGVFGLASFVGLGGEVLTAKVIAKVPKALSIAKGVKIAGGVRILRPAVKAAIPVVRRAPKVMLAAGLGKIGVDTATGNQVELGKDFAIVPFVAARVVKPKANNPIKNNNPVEEIFAPMQKEGSIIQDKITAKMHELGINRNLAFKWLAGNDPQVAALNLKLPHNQSSFLNELCLQYNDPELNKIAIEYMKGVRIGRFEFKYARSTILEARHRKESLSKSYALIKSVDVDLNAHRLGLSSQNANLLKKIVYVEDTNRQRTLEYCKIAIEYVSRIQRGEFDSRYAQNVIYEVFWHRTQGNQMSYARAYHNAVHQFQPKLKEVLHLLQPRDRKEIVEFLELKSIKQQIAILNYAKKYPDGENFMPVSSVLQMNQYDLDEFLKSR